MTSLHRYSTRALTQNCQSHRGHPSHREAFPTIPSIMNDITTYPVARARIWEPSLTSCFPSCSPANLSIISIPFLKSPGCILEFFCQCYYHCDLLIGLGSNDSYVGLVVYCLCFLPGLVFLPSSISSDCGDSDFSNIKIDYTIAWSQC